MIFHEIYGCYYQAVAKMINEALKDKLDEKRMQEIAAEYAYEESFLTMIPAIKNEEWQLFDKDYHTPILSKPFMPLTVLQKRWLKTILSDPRMELFTPFAKEQPFSPKWDECEPEEPLKKDQDEKKSGFIVLKKELADVEPLFEPEDIVHFDRYLDGDDYLDPAYVEHFHKVRYAIKERKKMKVTYETGKGRRHVGIFMPVKLEYSDKEDKFRIICGDSSDVDKINMGRIESVELLEAGFGENVILKSQRQEKLVFELINERKTLERAMMKFAHYKKEVERIKESTYRVELWYDTADETDVLIQVMSFGRFVKVLEPENIKRELAKRVERQLQMLAW